MSAPIDTNNNNIITNSIELAKQSKGGVEHVSPGDTASIGPSGYLPHCRLPLCRRNFTPVVTVMFTLVTYLT
jgi:hypothetical protein